MNKPVFASETLCLHSAVANDKIDNQRQNMGSDADWSTLHLKQIAAYNAWAEQRPTFSAEVLAWRESLQPEQPA